MLGVTTPQEALKLALEKSLDLVEISPSASPPVCKIMNYGKFKYEIQKKSQAAKKKQKVVETKEIKIRPTIATRSGFLCSLRAGRLLMMKLDLHLYQDLKKI
jgi:translation initiation factor IF-3